MISFTPEGTGNRHNLLHFLFPFRLSLNVVEGGNRTRAGRLGDDCSLELHRRHNPISKRRAKTKQLAVAAANNLPR